MGIKRCRGSEGEEGDSDIQMAMVLHAGSYGRLFECKTCNRQFPSFQALGGHRASHRRAQSAADEGQQAKRAASPAQPKTHECAICGAEFAMGQSLGGHMRRHRAELESACGGLAPTTKKPKRAPLDLNLPPGEHIKMGDFLGLGFVGKVPLAC